MGIIKQTLSEAVRVSNEFPDEQIEFCLSCAKYAVIYGLNAVEIAQKRINRRNNRVHETLIPASYDGERTAASNVKIVFNIRGKKNA